MKVKSFLRALSAFLVIALIFSAIPLVGIAVKSFATTEPDTPLQSAALNQLSVLGSDAEKKDAATVQNIKFYHTLDLASDISVTFAIAKTSLANYDSFYLECTLPVYSGNTLVGTKAVKVEPIVKGGYYYFTVTGITAVNMNDTIEAVLHMTKGGVEYISQTDSYSVAAYAYNTLNQNTDSKILALCANLLRYGAEAQSYKKYRTDALVDAAMTETHRSYLWDTSALTFTTTDKKLGDLANPTITWVGKTLGLDSKVGVKYVFNTKNYTGNLADLSMKISYLDSKGVAQTVTLTGAQAYGSTGTQYSFTFYGLLASELRTVLDAAVFQGETQLSETLRYSAETYAYNTRGNVLEPLCRALFAYSDSALIFFGGSLPVTNYTVTFKDWDGTVLKTETVASGQSATAPAAPSREGYTFIGWDKSFSSVTSDLIVTALYEEIPVSDPTIVVNKVTASAGQTVDVTVMVKNNPGVAGGTLILHFDAGLELTNASVGEAFGELDYTKPAKLKDGCAFNWDSLNQESHKDGTILTLSFAVPANAASGTVYNISISYRSGDIYNVDLNDVEFDLVAGSITVK